MGLGAIPDSINTTQTTGEFTEDLEAYMVVNLKRGQPLRQQERGQFVWWLRKLLTELLCAVVSLPAEGHVMRDPSPFFLRSLK